MQNIAIDASWFEGAVSVARVEDGWLPYRLPWDERKLHHRDLAMGAAMMASGIRLRFATDAEELALSYVPLWPAWAYGHHFDLTIEGELISSMPAEGSERVCFTGLPQGEKTVEIWFPQGAVVTLTGLQASDGATCRIVADPRPKWVAYGTSITHSVRSFSPSQTWPALVARKHELHLMNLGYGGQCHLEMLVGTMIRDLPADLITLKLGANTVNGTLDRRTFYPSVTGLVRLIREKHPETPLVLMTPIAFPQYELPLNAVGMNLQKMRADIEEAYYRLRELGDEHLYFQNGLELFDEALLDRYSDDQCHPKAEGQSVMAERFIEKVLDRISLERGLPIRA